MDVTGSSTGEVKEFHQARDHLVLLLGVSQTPVTSEAPAEYSLLRVQHQLNTQHGLKHSKRDKKRIPPLQLLTV